MNTRDRHSRQGSILLLSLWVIALLSIMAYGLVARVRMGVREEAWTEAEAEADNLLAALAVFSLQRLKADEDYDVDSGKEEWAKPFSVADCTVFLSQYEGIDPTCTDFRLSITAVDESGKINVNWAEEALLSEVVRETGAPSPAEIVHAIVDWRDPDETGAAERGFYESMSPPYAPRNDNLARLEELLLVRGIDDGLFVGEDANHNGRLDSNEDDGDVLWPRDNGDGALQAGFLDLLTVFGESGEININGASQRVLDAVLRWQLEDDGRAAGIAGDLGRYLVKDDSEPFRSHEDLTEFLVKRCGMEEAEAAEVAYVFSFTSEAFRFRLTVELPPMHLRKEAELVVTREPGTGELRVAEWRDV
ncbi:MAG: general secretion pathway protein GspK [Candidatus Hydrogenedentes bacterium]|nr:general secretion pathway protein GspK [Candidatus Hydrogenedentota bacterium]